MMRSRMATSRGPQRVLAAVLALVLVVCGLSYWRLQAVNTDLTAELHRLEGLLQTAEEKSLKGDLERREISDDLKKANAKAHQIAIEKEEDGIRCKHVKENLDELEENRAALQKQLDDEKDEQDRQLSDMSAKIDNLETHAAELEQQRDKERAELAKAQTELQKNRQELAKAQRELQTAREELAKAGGDSTCPARLAQVQSDLERCRAATDPSAPPGASGAVSSRKPWPGLVMPRGRLGQHLFESAGLDGFQQAQGRAGVAPPQQQQRVLPAPPAGPKSTSSSQKPPSAGQLAKPQSNEEASPPADAVEGAGVLRPPQPAAAAPRPQEQLPPPRAARPGPEPGAAIGVDDAKLQYPDDALKDDMEDPDPNQEQDDEDKKQEARDVALIRGLQELSNKSGQQEDVVGPADNVGGAAAAGLGGLEPAPVAQQPPLR